MQTLSPQTLSAVYPSGPSDLIPPIIRQGPANLTLASGSSALLQCHVMGSPFPSVRWEKDGQSVLADDIHISLMENGTLHINGVKVFDRRFRQRLELFALFRALKRESSPNRAVLRKHFILSETFTSTPEVMGSIWAFHILWLTRGTVYINACQKKTKNSRVTFIRQ